MEGSIGIVSLAALAVTHPEAGVPVGGAEVQLHLLARALAAQGHAVTLYVADVGQGVLEEEGIRLQPLMPLAEGLRLRPRDFPAAFLRLARARHNLYITRGASSINGLTSLAAHCARRNHMHMCASDEEAAGLAEATLSFFARRLHHMGLRRANVLTCQNRTQQEDIRRVFKHDAVLIPSLPHRVSEIGGPRAGFLWVGRDIEVKDPEAFIELARRLPGQTFTMVCQPQPGRDLERLRAAAPPNLRFVPGAPYAQVCRLYGRHKACVCTSTAEGFPNTFVHAAGSATPILSLTVNPDNLLAQTGAGLACNGDFDALVESCRRVAEDDTLWQRLSAGARTFAKRHDGAVDEVLTVVRQAMQG